MAMALTSIHDALVIGAGPAGAAAAWALARAGRRVALVDRDAFPRDKICGDGLIPDSLGALDTMGLREAVAREAVEPRALHVVAPGGDSVSLGGEFLCVPRFRLDALLVEAAVSAGAELMPPMSVLQPIEEAGHVRGARFRAAGPRGARFHLPAQSPAVGLPGWRGGAGAAAGECEVRARFTLLATGANATVTNAFGLSTPLKSNAVAGRAYFNVPPALADKHRQLSIVYDRWLSPGYGWIFPGPGHRYNVGVGFFSDGRGETPSLRQLWTHFTTRFAPAAELVERSQPITEFRGAPMRIGLYRATLGRRGLLVLGDAAAMTYPGTGEGIGKAMESGLLAARLVCEGLFDGSAPEFVHRAYDSEFRRQFAARYQAYWTAQAWSSRPWLLNLLVSRANTGRFVRRELEALIAERGNPSRLFSVRGIIRALFE
jgi:menaquinone-9 beta-reductase